MLKYQYWLLKRRITKLTGDNSGTSFWIGSLYFFTFLAILPIMCRNWCYSKYYIKIGSRAELEISAMDINTYDATKAKEYLSHLHLSDIENVRRNTKGVDLAIGIITVPRQIRAQKVEYLTQTFAKLYQNILQDIESNFSKALFICSVFAGPGEHTEVDGLGSLAHVRTRFPVNDPSAVIMDRFNKEKDDYAYCIDEALKYKPKYVLMVEDDALPYTDMFPVLNALLDDRFEQDSFHGRATMRTKEWSYLKLYYPERWKGYSFEDIPLVELTGFGLIGGSLFLYLGSQFNKRKRSRILIRAQFVAGFVYLILMAVMVGRPYMIEWRRISKFTYTVVPAPDCCSPAILYPADKARHLSDHFKELNCSASFPLDAALETISGRFKKFTKYLVEPNLVQHIGMLSSIKTWSDNPQEFLHRAT